LTAFDLVAGLILLASALLGLSRGGVQEMVTLVAFTFSATIGVFLLPISAPISHALVHTGWLSKVVAVVVVFLIAYVAMRIAGAALSSALHRQAALGALDRTVGFCLGLARGLVALGLFCLVFSAVTPRWLQPHWIVGGPIYGVGQTSGRLIASVAPQGLKAVGGFGRVLSDQVHKTDDSGEAEPLGDGVVSQGSDMGGQTANATPNSSASDPYSWSRRSGSRSKTLSIDSRPAE
jgi:membrane protein required for colicin V production